MVGQKGTRVQVIVDELKENADIIKWSEDPAELIGNSLPAKVVSVDINEEEKTAAVIVPTSSFPGNRERRSECKTGCEAYRMENRH